MKRCVALSITCLIQKLLKYADPLPELKKSNTYKRPEVTITFCMDNEFISRVSVDKCANTVTMKL